MDSAGKSEVVTEVQQWLNDVVVGLNLCPFARKPMRAGQIRFAVSEAKNDADLLDDLLSELQKLDSAAAETLETTLLIVPEYLQDFYEYNFFLGEAERLLEQHDYPGIYQIASLHPNYQFAGSNPEDAENLTNRSPYPIFHLLREESLERALKNYPDPESIPHNNILRVEALTDEEKRKLFPYLFS